jgi:gas vesicle protein
MKGDTLFAFLGGAILGAAVAILFAPDSGDETRKKIKDTFDKEYQTLKSKIRQPHPSEGGTESAPAEE